MRSLKVLLSRAGVVLLALDLALLLPGWPVLLRLVAPAHWQVLLSEPAMAVFPLAQVTLLYALGLYRRDAILSLRRALLRLPLVVMLSVLVAGLFLRAVQWQAPGAAPVDVTVLCSAAIPVFALCAALARVILFMLLRRGVFRRRIMVVGAGQRAAEPGQSGE